MAKTNYEKGSAEDLNSDHRGSKTLARDVMSSVLTVIQPEQTFRFAVELLNQKRLTVLPVVDKDGKLLGLLSEKDVLSACRPFEQTVPHFLDEPIRYRKKVRKASLKTPIEKISAILAKEAVRHLPVVDREGMLKGIITRRDLIRIIYLRLELNKDKDDLFEI